MLERNLPQLLFQLSSVKEQGSTSGHLTQKDYIKRKEKKGSFAE